jgi:hypothetical protein
MISLAWRAETVHGQIVPGTEFGILPEGWIPGEAPNVPPVNTPLTVHFPNGAVGRVNLVAISDDDAVSKMTGKEWLGVGANKQDFEICLGYLLAVADTAQVFQAWLPDTDKSCIPETLSATDLVATGTDFIRAHPYYHELPAAWGLAAAFNRKWPCRK